VSTSALPENWREHSRTGENNSFAEGCGDLLRMPGAYLEAKEDSARNARPRRVDYIVSYVGMSADFLERKQYRVM